MASDQKSDAFFYFCIDHHKHEMQSTKISCLQQICYAGRWL